MNLVNLLVGMVIGAVMSIPVGPTGLIGLKRILSRGALAGMASGLGVALGDTLFAAAAVTGIAGVRQFISRYDDPLQITGGLVVLLIGLWGLLHYRQHIFSTTTGGDAARDCVSLFFITLANPQTIIGFTAAFAMSVGFYEISRPLHAFLLILGVFVGSLGWWVVLSLLVDHFRHRIGERQFFWLHQAAGVLLIFIGLALMLHGFSNLNPTG